MVEQFFGVKQDGTIVTADCTPEQRVVGGVDVVLGLHACGNATDHIQELALRLRAAYLVSPCCIGKLSFSMRGGTSFSAGSHAWTSGGESVDVPKHVMTHPRSQWLTTGVAKYCADAVVEEVCSAGTVAMAAVRASPEALVRSLVRLADISTVEQPDNVDQRGTEGDTPEQHDRFYPRRLLAARLAKLHVELDRSMRARENGYETQHFKLLDHDTAQQSKSDLLLGLPAEWSFSAELIAEVDCAPIPSTSEQAQ
jgi:hypothetical protein